jgi:tetratricopeptide (TPR) repeat protein
MLKILTRPSLIAISLVFVTCAGLLGPDIKPGVELFEAGNYAGALAHYEGLIAADGSNAKVYRLAYESAFKAGKRVTAARYYDEALKAGYESDSLQSLALNLWYERVLKVMGTDQWKEARKAAQQIATLAPGSKQDKFCRLMLDGNRKYTRGAHKGLWDAISDYSKAANLNPQSGLPYFLMGQARYKNNRTDYDAALDDYRESLKIEPNGYFASKAKAEIKKIEAVKKKMNKFWGK